MKKNLVHLVAFVFIILISSCKKNSNADQTTNTNKVKTYTEDVTSPSSGHNVITFNISYDASDRIVSAISTTSSGDKFLFNYTSNSKYSQDLYVSGTLSIHEDFFMNSNSLPDSTFQYNDTNDTTTEKYFYNSGNQLTSMNEYIYSTITGTQLDNTTNYTYDTNGNLVGTTDTNNQIETYDYYSDLVNVMPSVIPGSNPTLNSKKKMNLVKTHTVTSNGSLVGSTISTYTFDSNNRISTIKQTADDGTIAVQTFTYF